MKPKILLLSAAFAIFSLNAAGTTVENINGNNVTFSDSLDSDSRNCLREAVRSSGYTGITLEYSNGGAAGVSTWINVSVSYGDCSRTGRFRLDLLKCDKWNVIVVPDCTVSGNGGDT